MNEQITRGMYNGEPRGAYIGDWPATIELTQEHLFERDVFIDCRGPIIIEKGARIGWRVQILTLGHELTDAWPVVPRGVTIKRGAWIGAFSILYNCYIGEGAVVAVGSVVRSCDVLPYTMVAGNPCQVIGRKIGAEWNKVGESYRILE
jgi:acetyltransferase-like isoleucine patch superfamily enzyme